MASTLPPDPSFNPHIPIISSAGGTPLAYEDPNSPESIMKRTTLVKAQGAVNSKYDVDPAAALPPATEGFIMNFNYTYILFSLLLLLLLLLLLFLVKYPKVLKKKLFLLLVAAIIIICIIPFI